MLSETVRRGCAEIAAAARWVRIDETALAEPGGIAGLDPELHFLDGTPEEVARYILVLDAVNFGSGWFTSLRLPPGQSGTEALTRRLTEHARGRGGTWTAAELRDLRTAELAAVLDQDPGHPLVELYAEALHQLGRWLGERRVLDVIAEAGGSAQRFAGMLATGMPFFDDVGFYKRAQITANDLALAGVARFADIDRLTIFADNLVPHVLRHDGVLRYSPELAAHVDAGRLLPAGGGMEREIRACAVHACELLAARFGVPPRTLDNWLWNRGERTAAAERPAHRTRTVFY
jgi:Potential Queuosine, Q, salvage protein family